jgi:hypothetical protein
MRYDTQATIRLAFVLLGAWSARLAAQDAPAALTARATRRSRPPTRRRPWRPGARRSQLILGPAYLSHARAYPGLGAIGKVKRGRAAVERAIALDPDNLDARSTLMQFLLQAPVSWAAAGTVPGLKPVRSSAATGLAASSPG